MVLKLHYDFLSQPSRAVYLLLKCSGVEFEGVVKDIVAGECRKPEYEKENPFKVVPFIEYKEDKAKDNKDKDIKVTECMAIMRFIAAKFDLEERWYPRRDFIQQAWIDMFLSWQQTNLRAPCVDVFLGMFRDKCGVGVFTKAKMDEAKVKAAKEKIAEALKTIEKQFLKDKQFIGGEKISAADLLAACELHQLDIVNQLDIILKGNPKVKAWFERVEKTLGKEWKEATAKVKSCKEMYTKAASAKK